MHGDLVGYQEELERQRDVKEENVDEVKEIYEELVETEETDVHGVVNDENKDKNVRHLSIIMHPRCTSTLVK